MTKVFRNLDPETPFSIWGEFVRADWCRLGEGYTGDYNPNDPNDKELLRFDIYKRESEDDAWEAADDASYCTFTGADTIAKDPAILLELLRLIFKRYEEVLQPPFDVSVKKLGEDLSWIDPEQVRISYERNGKEIPPLPQMFDTEEYLWYSAEGIRPNYKGRFCFRVKGDAEPRDFADKLDEIAQSLGYHAVVEESINEIDAETVVTAYRITDPLQAWLYMTNDARDELIGQANTLDSVFTALKMDEDMEIDEEALYGGILRVYDKSTGIMYSQPEIYDFLLHDALAFKKPEKKLVDGMFMDPDLLQKLINDAAEFYIYI